MKIFYLLLFGFISCRTISNIIDIWYNYEYSFIKDYQNYDEYPFRLEVIEGDKIDLEIKVNKNEMNYFTIKAYEFSYYPSNVEIYNYGGIPLNNLNKFVYIEGNYSVYSYIFQASQISKYFAIHLQKASYFAYTYLSFRANVAKYKYSFIKDLNYNSSYDIDTNIFPDGKIPYFYQTFIRTEVKKGENMIIQLTTDVNYDKNSTFQVDVCDYINKPTEANVYYNNTGAQKCTNNIVNFSDEEKKYKYNYNINEEINYTSIRILNKVNDLNYLNIYIDSIKPSPQPTDDPTPHPTDDPTPHPTDDPSPEPKPTSYPTDTPKTDGNGDSSKINKVSSILLILLIINIL